MTTTNSGGDRGQALVDQLDTVIAGARAQTPQTQEFHGDVARYCAALVDRIRQAGVYAHKHGTFIEQMSMECAQDLEDLIEKYAVKLMEAEHRKMAELEKLLGKSGR